MKLSLQRFLNGKRTLLILFLCCFTVFNLQAQTVTCPTDTFLGEFDCTTLGEGYSEVPDPPNTIEEAMAAPYNLVVDGVDGSTRVKTEDSDIIFYCVMDARIVTRTVTVYNDANFNFACDDGEAVGSCDFTIETIEDITPPTFVVPPLAETTCEEGYDPEITGLLEVVEDENCPVRVISEYANFADAIAQGGCNGELIVTRSWTAIDPCGNTSPAQTQMIVVMDNEGPTFTPPADITLTCDQDPNDPAITGTVTDAMDLCDDSEIQVNGIIVPDLTQEDTPCPGSTIYTKRWGAEDDCGNVTIMDQLITVECPPDCNNDDICVGDILADPLPGECECQIVEVQVLGCMDPAACNYNPDANCDDGSCIDVPTCNDDPCVGDVTTLSANGCDCELVTPQVIGCTNPDASNYDATANCPCNDGEENDCCLLNFDLALNKVLTSAGPFVIGTGASVTFTITVFNQGDVTAQNIEITDYTPTGLILDDAAWTESGATAVTTIAGPLDPGASTTVDITYTIDPTVMPGTYTNFAEISAADDPNGNPGMDSDSTPDNNPDNDNYTDDVIDNTNDDEDDHDGAEFTLDCATPTCNPDPCEGDVTVLSDDGCSCVLDDQVLGCTDPDACNYNPDANCDDDSCMAVPVCNDDPCVGDITELSADECSCVFVEAQVIGCTDSDALNYDPAANCPCDASGDNPGNNECCVPKICDLALVKDVVSMQPFAPGDDVTYAITVANEGNIDALNIEVYDDIPGGLTFNAAQSPGWAITGSIVTTTIPGPLAPSASETLNITFTINENAAEGNLTNIAEISYFEGPDGEECDDIDSTPDTDPNNDPPEEDDHDIETIEILCPDDAGEMGSALKSVCGGDNVNAPAEGVVVGQGSVHVYLLHDGTGAIIYDFSTNGTFVNDGTYPTNVELYISSAVGPPGPDGIPDLGATCADVVLPGCPVIFYDPISINPILNCDKTTGTASVSFTISGGAPPSTGGTYSVTGSFNGSVNPGQQYVIDGISDGSTYSITVVNDGKNCTAEYISDPIRCGKLPVELISYEGEVQSNGNLLKWVTASEIENDFYTLERASADMKFVEINVQKGAGTFSTPSKYTYLDREAPNGLSYYQLKQTDFDGTMVIVGLVELQRSEPTFDIINIYPIPVLENFELFIESEEDQTIEIQVINSIGELMLIEEFELTDAVNKVEMNLSSLASGVYVISAIAGDNTVSQKIIKY